MDLELPACERRRRPPRYHGMKNKPFSGRGACRPLFLFLFLSLPLTFSVVACDGPRDGAPCRGAFDCDPAVARCEAGQCVPCGSGGCIKPADIVSSKLAALDELHAELVPEWCKTMAPRCFEEYWGQPMPAGSLCLWGERSGATGSFMFFLRSALIWTDAVLPPAAELKVRMLTAPCRGPLPDVLPGFLFRQLQPPPHRKPAASGAACNTDYDCSDGFCEGDGASTCGGTCKPWEKSEAKSPCKTDPCPAGTYCPVGDASSTKLACQKWTSLGGECEWDTECGSDAICWPAAFPEDGLRVCTERREHGQTCLYNGAWGGFTDPTCAAGLRCTLAFEAVGESVAIGRCATETTADQACHGHGQCGAFLQSCAPDGGGHSCQPVTGLHQPCEPTPEAVIGSLLGRVGPCLGRLECAQDTKTCEIPPLATDAPQLCLRGPCPTGTFCGSSGRCWPGVMPGGTCTAKDLCAWGGECRDGRCSRMCPSPPPESP